MCLTHTQIDWVVRGTICHKDQLYIQNGDTDTIYYYYCYYYYYYYFKSDPLTPCRVDWLVTSLSIQSTTSNAR